MTDHGARHRGLLLAGVLLAGAGIFDAIAGIADLTTHQYVSLATGGIHEHDITGWAALHLVVGMLTAVAGALVPLGRRWSSWLGVAAATIFIALHLVYLMYHPIQAVIVVGLALAAVRLIRRNHLPATS
ncbi:DUF7144 family membrane protein [Micromonospora sp. CA-263727]|uniref:DUF7144 family membrane protein n=1 Tax=Micromonospora sp. CA-263727 TaxID=3239967 RepID=UPI003D8A6AA9